MMIAVLSVSKSERGRAKCYACRHGLLALAVRADLEVRDITHVERMIDVRIGIAGRAGSKWPPALVNGASHWPTACRWTP